MLCFRCGSHNPDGSEFCSQCSQKFNEKRRPPKDPSEPVLPAQRPGAEASGGHLANGTHLSERYEIRATLGVGPVGTVYRAHDLEIDVDVAIKVISSQLLQGRDERKRFLSELRAVRKVNHPHVVRLYDEDQHEDMVFFTMQLLEGLSLRKIVKLRKEKSQRFQVKEIEPIFAHVCQALDRAHEVIAHGDLKPENIIVLPDLLKVTDLGLAVALPGRPFVAAQKSPLGGFAYLAPELRDGAARPEPAADIYSLGVVLCEILSGEVYAGPNSGLPKLPKEHEGLLPLLSRALNENPANRQRAPREFFEELHAALNPASRTAPAKARPAPAAIKDAPAGEDDAQGLAARPVTRPPRAAPSRKKVGPAAQDPAYPPTVISEAPPEPEPVRPRPSALPRDEDEALEELAGEPEEIEDIEEVDEEVRADPEEEDSEQAPMDDQETFVATPTPAPSAVGRPGRVPDEARVARPLEAGRPPEPPPEPVKVLERKRTPTLPSVTVLPSEPPAPAQVEGPPGVPPPPGAMAPPGVSVPPPSGVFLTPGTIPGAPMPPYSYPPGYQPSYPPGYQPPYQSGMYPAFSQPPPQPSRLPLYLFLSLITLIVGVGVYFLVDYLIAAKKELAKGSETQVASVSPTPGPTGPSVEELRQAEEARRSEETRRAADEKRKADETARLAADEKRKADEAARLAEEARKADQDKRKAEELRLASLKVKTGDPAEERQRKAEEARRIEDQRRQREADLKRKAEEARVADEARRRAEADRKAEAARKAEEDRARKAEEARKAAATPAKPKLEEVPDGDEPPAPAPARVEPPPRGAEVASAVEPAPEAKGGKCPKGMVLIPAGAAMIGSAVNDPMRNFGELNLHKVELAAFCVDLYEHPNAPGRKPTSSISWAQADKVCKKAGKRLCTEEEWEYACKGAGNRSFPYGNQFEQDRCNTKDANDEPREVASIGTYMRCRSPFGVIDLSGNVSEWTASAYQGGSSSKTVKGGSSSRPTWATRCATRSSLAPTGTKPDLGFRCCANPK